ncbi:metal-dependent hydrolase family protein [Aestuariivivens sediminis]|uniref:metal-dependent hydrolase family protein n=1 Tax=Aestuariivivens sediminis TaxID=2913557 RepID=UPI001F5659F5|nr:amidohydrolase family protein [Aestuariivivens sediminis]
MKHILLFIAILLSVLSIEAQSKLIKANAYLNVRTGKLIKPANLLIENGLIKSINPKSIPNNVEIIDLSNKILLPGLMDMHVHLDMDFMKNHANLMVTENSSKRTLRAVKNAEKTLLAGFTTIRNLGQIHPTKELIDVALSEASDDNWIVSPRIIPCGHMIGTTGGHADLSMFGNFAEGVMDLSPEYGIADGNDEVLKATRYQIKHGAKAIKIMATAGVTSLEKHVGAQQLTFEEMKTIVEEANRHGITVAAHAHGAEGIIVALRAGVTSIEHGFLLNDEAISLMKKKNTFLVPTIPILKEIDFESLDPIVTKKAKLIIKKSNKNHQKAVNEGIKIAFGTDAPIILSHGKNAMEFQALIDIGLTPLDAIQAATINSAEMLNLNDRGEIKSGFLADIIAVNLNPIENIRTLENVVFVMKDGIVFKN